MYLKHTVLDNQCISDPYIILFSIGFSLEGE